MHEVEVLRVHRYALQDRSNAAHNDESHIMANEAFNQSEESVLEHG